MYFGLWMSKAIREDQHEGFEFEIREFGIIIPNLLQGMWQRAALLYKGSG